MFFIHYLFSFGFLFSNFVHCNCRHVKRNLTITVLNISAMSIQCVGVTVNVVTLSVSCQCAICSLISIFEV